MTMDKFLAGKKRLESINNSHYSIGVPRGTFEERHKRVTLYLEIPLFEQIQDLRREGKIPNLTNFVNKALISFLKNNQYSW